MKKKAKKPVKKIKNVVVKQAKERAKQQRSNATAFGIGVG